jgi:hypothetical protein
MMEDKERAAIRGWFAVRCRDPGRRTDGRKMGIANRWQPSTVRHPELHGYFTDAGAWDFIADCLEANETLQHLPPTKEFPDYAVYMVHLSIGEERRIYMKLATRRELDMVIGVSFHYSNEEYLS